MRTATQPLLAVGFPAIAAAVGFLGIAVFQIALALGAPMAQAAWGGSHQGQLPTGLRVASAAAAVVWILAALIVLGRAGASVPMPPAAVRWGIWVLVGVLPLGAVMNFASPSGWERFLWGPVALSLAIVCFLVARYAPMPTGG